MNTTTTNTNNREIPGVRLLSVAIFSLVLVLCGLTACGFLLWRSWQADRQATRQAMLNVIEARNQAIKGSFITQKVWSLLHDSYKRTWSREKFSKELLKIPTEGCPPEFRKAWCDYVRASSAEDSSEIIDLALAVSTVVSTGDGRDLNRVKNNHNTANPIERMGKTGFEYGLTLRFVGITNAIIGPRREVALQIVY